MKGEIRRVISMKMCKTQSVSSYDSTGCATVYGNDIKRDIGFRISNNIKDDKECFVTVQKQMNNKYFILWDQYIIIRGKN